MRRSSKQTSQAVAKEGVEKQSPGVKSVSSFVEEFSGGWDGTPEPLVPRPMQKIYELHPAGNSE
jgi:hypothetical protein